LFINIKFVSLIIDDTSSLFLKFPNDLISFDDRHLVDFGYGLWLNAEFSSFIFTSENNYKAITLFDELDFSLRVFKDRIFVATP
jgi:hypothetical protein